MHIFSIFAYISRVLSVLPDGNTLQGDQKILIPSRIWQERGGFLFSILWKKFGKTLKVSPITK
jgi:hypothetical protein